jgi:hypothetical protein
MNAQKPYQATFVQMNNEVIPYLNQLPELSHQEFLRKLEAQLAKDLYPAEWDEISDNPTPTGLVDSLHRVVSSLIQEHSKSLGQVLYRIDISEGKIRNLMSATDAEERASVLAAEILEREAKKVWLRMNFSQNT